MKGRFSRRLDSVRYEKGEAMSKLLKVTLLLAVAIGFCGAYRYGAAQDTGSSEGRAHFSPPTFDVQVSLDPNVLATSHVLEKTYNNNGLYGPISVPALSYTPIDTPLTVVCPGTSGTCTIQADMWIENGGQTSTGNQNSICLYVDGHPSPFCSYDAGETPSDGGFVQTSTSQSVSGLAHGNHTVQMYFSTDDGVAVLYFNSTYRVYKP
jgi:hypothetical protein